MSPSASSHLHSAILKWNYDFKNGQIHFQVWDLFSVIWISSIKDHASSLYTIGIKPNTTLWAVRKQSVWQILKKILSCMMLDFLEYRFLWALSTLRPIRIKGYLPISLCISWEILPLISSFHSWIPANYSPLTLTLVSWLLTDWLLSKNISSASKGVLPGIVCVALE